MSPARATGEGDRLTPQDSGYHAFGLESAASAGLPGVLSAGGQAFFFFFFLGGKDIHYTSAMIATSRVCDVHHKPERPKLTTHLELFRHES